MKGTGKQKSLLLAFQDEMQQKGNGHSHIGVWGLQANQRPTMAQMKAMGSGALGNSETRRIVSDVVNDATDGGNTGGKLSVQTSFGDTFNQGARRGPRSNVKSRSALHLTASRGRAAHILTVTGSPRAGRDALCLLSAPAPLLQASAAAALRGAAGLAALV